MESNLKINFIIRLFVLGLLFAWCFILIRPFIIITLWGGVLATTTIRSVTRGIIGVAIIQTFMVGIGLILAKIPAAGLLTLLSLFLSIMYLLNKSG
jgi:predicted PurR-regulated permease PerM